MCSRPRRETAYPVGDHLSISGPVDQTVATFERRGIGSSGVILPDWLQTVAYLLPSTYVFEGMRTVFNAGRCDTRLLVLASVMNLVYLGIAGIFFSYMMRQVRKKGYLTRTSME